MVNAEFGKNSNVLLGCCESVVVTKSADKVENTRKKMGRMFVHMISPMP